MSLLCFLQAGARLLLRIEAPSVGVCHCRIFACLLCSPLSLFLLCCCQHREKRADHLALSLLFTACILAVSLVSRMANRKITQWKEKGWGGQWRSVAVALRPARQPARIASVGQLQPHCGSSSQPYSRTTFSGRTRTDWTVGDTRRAPDNVCPSAYVYCHKEGHLL